MIMVNVLKKIEIYYIVYRKYNIINKIVNAFEKKIVNAFEKIVKKLFFM